MADPLSPGLDEASQESTSRKRKRIPIACSACRARKSRCDGQRPKCSSCIEQSLDCIYASNTAPKDALVPKLYLDLVEARLASVETDIRRLKSQVSSTHASDQTGNRSLPPSQTDPSLFGGTGTPPFHDAISSERSPDATDGVGTVEFTNEETWAYFGPSSNIAFTRIIRRTLGHLLHKSQATMPIPLSRSSTQGNALPVSRPSSPQADLSVSWTANMVNATVLPDEPQATMLIKQFFSETGMLFPYINEVKFWDTYGTLTGPGRRTAGIRYSWLGLLNMMLAMAISTAIQEGVSMEDRYSQSEIYFKRAKTLCLDQMLTGASVEAVQVMLLMTQYLQGTHRSIKTWSIHGLAVRGALQLGLHSTQALQRFDPLERETRIRTWYGCVALDRTLSMTFGRPPSIPQNFIRTLLPCHHVIEHQSRQTIPWSPEEKSTLFYNATITLYSINAAVIQELYGNNIGDVNVFATADMASAVFHMEQQLFNWQSSLPSALQLVDAPDVLSAGGDTLGWKFRVILSLRYHNLRILAHRPILDRFLQRMDGTDQLAHEAATLSQIGHMSKTFCLSSAQAIIEITSVCMEKNGEVAMSGFLGAWWFTLYYTLNASLVIAAIMLTELDEYNSGVGARQSEAVDIDRLDTDLESALSIMSKLDTQNKILDKCVKFTATLRYLLQGLKKQGSCPRGGIDEGVNMGMSQEHGVGLNVNGDMVSSMLETLPHDFQFNEFGFGSEDMFKSPAFIDNFTRQGDLFW
ncbi:fungal-specific transcription factor domain-containing protein [Plectosphaerella plurivora]|uniref:Fungal-specific transcription factor domain-containing protein n=1 Tax=Plectosphaerella plurivora TaxID=936078 RepID=A0A9P9AB19_9PEZI|nr:fungal-specific transcription factor domain-containing protein [Plectosphaerella plurivora]